MIQGTQSPTGTYLEFIITWCFFVIGYVMPEPTTAQSLGDIAVKTWHEILQDTSFIIAIAVGYKNLFGWVWPWEIFKRKK